MKFKVKFFKGEIGDGEVVVNIKREEIGIEGVDFIRRRVGPVDLENIYGLSNSLWMDCLTISVSEDFARRHYDLFKNRSEVEVEMEKNYFLNHFCYRKVAEGKIKDKKCYYIDYSLSEKSLIKAWEKAGCPRRWKVGMKLFL